MDLEPSGCSYIYVAHVYKPTTVAKGKCLKNLLPEKSKSRRSLLPLLNGFLAYENPYKKGKLDPHKMPSVNAEETALLSMHDIELKNIQMQFPMALRISGDVGCSEERVRTDRADILVAVQGDRCKPAIITYHDIGLNYTCFQTFFNYVDMRALMENFCVYHVTAPGQEEGAPNLPDDYIYPTMDELANQLNYVLGHFGIHSFIGFGVGAGANILARFALTNSQKVDALVLINCSSNKASWIDWGIEKMNSRALRQRGMTENVLNYLMWHHFGRAPEERNYELAQTYRTFITRINPVNMSMFIGSFMQRGALGISRDAATLQPPVLNITGALSPHVNDTVTFNGRLQPANSTWMKISDAGNVLEEQPGKVSEAFRLFLQGEGYVAPLSPTKMVAFRRLSGGARRRCRHSPVIRITENPISEAVVC